MSRLLRVTAVRWALGIAAWSVVLALLLVGFVYWQTAQVMQEELAEAVRHEARYAASDPGAAAARIENWVREDLHNVHFAGIFGPDDVRLAGNIEALPPGVRFDGEVRRIGARVSIAGRERREDLWSVALRLPDGRALVVAHDTDEVDRVAQAVLRAIGLAAMPTLVLSVVGGAMLAGRGRRRIAATEAAIARLVRGDLSQRLPLGGADDEFDRLARNVNGMLDQIERLVEEVRGVGDAVAHDLRTPLTRLRARLERCRAQATTVEEFRDAIDQGLDWIDQTLGMVSAVLRIGEIEHGRRCESFADLDLAELVREVAEFIEPLAEEKAIAVTVLVEEGSHLVRGDRDLIFEALSNLLDNAVKFTPEEGRVAVGLEQRGSEVTVFVEDTGPGIPAGERERVFQRFYRAEPGRKAPGNGLGLALVGAVASLHGFAVSHHAAPHGGSRFELRCQLLPQVNAGQPR
jgi:signal transduction histidine kinase